VLVGISVRSSDAIGTGARHPGAVNVNRVAWVLERAVALGDSAHSVIQKLFCRRRSLRCVRDVSDRDTWVVNLDAHERRSHDVRARAHPEAQTRVACDRRHAGSLRALSHLVAGAALLESGWSQAIRRVRDAKWATRLALGGGGRAAAGV